MDDKKHFLKMLICFGACFAVMGGFVWLIDPFYHYHEPLFNIPVVLDNAVYQTAGAAQNLKYDSAIVGTSMTENMHTSWFDEEMGWDTMKLSYSGARSDDLRAIFEQISQKDGEIKNIVMDLNEYQLTVAGWTKYVERPEYLYDNYLYNDYEYLYNHDIVLRSAERCLDRLTGREDNIDSAYIWEDASLFGKQIALNANRGQREKLLRNKESDEEIYWISGSVSENLQEKLAVCQENLDNILPFIDSHPDTNFYIMLPPYSMLYWELKVLADELDDTTAIYSYAVKKLLQYENVKIYYFQKEEEIITNLDNYRDSTHYKPEYNRYMFECLRDEKNLLTSDNYEEKLNEMYEFARDFAYADLWKE